MLKNVRNYYLIVQLGTPFKLNHTLLHLQPTAWDSSDTKIARLIDLSYRALPDFAGQL